MPIFSPGIRGFWNFTNVELSSETPGVSFEDVHFADSLLTLSYRRTGSVPAGRRTWRNSPAPGTAPASRPPHKTPPPQGTPPQRTRRRPLLQYSGGFPAKAGRWPLPPPHPRRMEPDAAFRWFRGGSGNLRPGGAHIKRRGRALRRYRPDRHAPGRRCAAQDT